MVKLIHKLNRLVNRTGLGERREIRWAKRPVKRFVHLWEWLRRTSGDLPICWDLERKALIVYPEKLRRYEYEDPFMIRLFAETVRPGDGVLDLGAHHGLYSIVAAKRVGPAGRVYAFEPEPESFKVLLDNVTLNGYGHIVEAVQKCVGSERRSQRLAVAEELSRSNAVCPHPLMSIRSEVVVECVTIDEFLSGRAVNVVKMDIEGSEPEALRGMVRTVHANRDLTLFCEMHPTMLGQRGITVEAYLKQLEALGFQVHCIREESRSVTPVSLEYIKEKARDPWWHTNLLAVKGKR